MARDAVTSDRGTYWSFWILGAGVLLSWNVLICSLPMFTSFFSPTSGYRNTLTSYLSTAFTVVSLIMMGVAQRGVGKVSSANRLSSALYVLAFVMGITFFPLLPLVFPRLPPPALLSLLLVLTALLAGTTSYFQSSVFAIASLWGSKEMLAVMSGQGGIAVLISLVQVYLAVVAAYASKSPSTTPVDGQADKATIVSGMGLWLMGTISLGACIFARRRIVKQEQSKGTVDVAAAEQYEEIDQTEREIEDEEVETIRKPVSETRSDTARTMAVFKKNILLELSVAWVFIVTLAVFPPVTMTILSVREDPPKILQAAVFIPLHFLMFNVADYIGRTYVPNIKGLLLTNHYHVLAASFSRTLFIPLFLACNTITHKEVVRKIPLVDSDVLYFLIVFAFGCSNGYISSLSMILSSSPDLNPRIEHSEKHIAGTLAAFCLVGGLAMGSVASFAVRWLVRGGNPFVE